MKKIAELIIKYRYLLFIIILAGVGWLGSQAKNIRMNNDMASWMDQSDPAVRLYTHTGNKFGSNYINMVVLKTKDIFTTENLSLVRRLTKAYEAIDGVYQVVSLTNILDVKPLPDGLEVKSLINKGPITKDNKKLKTLKRYVLSKERYRGFMVNDSGNATMIMVRLHIHADKNKISQIISQKADKMIPPNADVKVYIGGMPMAIYYADKLVNQDMGRLTPIVTLLILLVLFASFRSLQGTLLPLFTVLFATISTVGLMALFKVPLTMISASLPVVLLSTGTAYGIHLINASRELRLQGMFDPKQRIITSVDKVGLGILLAALTTMFGFGSLATAQLVPIKNLGIFLAIGIFLALLLTFLLILPILSVWNVKAKPDVKKPVKGYLVRILTKIADSVSSHAAIYAILALVIGIVALFFAFRMTREVNLTNYFPPDNPVRQAEKVMKKDFGGSTPVVVDFDAKSIKNPAVLRVIQRVQKMMRATPHLKHPSGVVDFLSEMNFIMNKKRTTPNTQQGVDNLWLFIEGKKELSQMIDDAKKETILQATIDQSNSKLMADVTKDMQERLKNVPKNIVTVDLDKTNSIQHKKLAEIITTDAMRELQDDLTYAGIRLKNKGKVRAAMLKAAFGSLLSADIRQKTVKKAVNKYMMSDSAELEVTQAVATNVARTLGTMKKWDASRVFTDLKQWIPEDQWKDDPDSLTAMSQSLKSVFHAAINDYMVTSVYDILKQNLSSPLAGLAPEIRQRVMADLWELRENTVYVSQRDYEQVFGKPASPSAIIGLQTTLTGEAKVMTQINDQLVVSQAESLGIAILMVFILMTIQFRSLSGGLLSMIPIVFTVLFNFGLMGLFKIPLDNATAMISSVAIGLGIDYTIHVMLRFKKEYALHNDTRLAMESTLSSVGRAVLINSLAVTLGFLVLLFSNMEPLRRFGYLMAITMVVSAIAALTIFPAAVLVTKAKFLTRPAGPKEA